MTDSLVMTVGRDAMLTGLMLGGPVLAVSLGVGLVVSLFQAVTQINEQTLSFVPKLLAVGVAFLALGPWMMQEIVLFTTRLFEMLPYMVR